MVIFNFGAYDMNNKLPYTFNFKFDVQWQPRNDLAITIGYSGNLGRHAVIPVPFNEPGIASSASPIPTGKAQTVTLIASMNSFDSG